MVTEKGTPWRKTIRGIVFNTALKVRFSICRISIFSHARFSFSLVTERGTPFFIRPEEGKEKGGVREEVWLLFLRFFVQNLIRKGEDLEGILRL